VRRKERCTLNIERGYNLNSLILESTEHGEVPVDIYQKLSNDRILFICGNYIDDKISTDIVATLLLKDSEDSESKITLFINAEGGDIRDVLMIYDMMNLIRSPIETVCIGSSFNETSILLTSGTKGMRFATKNAVISVSQLTSEAMNISTLFTAKSILDRSIQDHKRMMDIIAKGCDKSVKDVMKDFERETFMTSAQAVKYGLIDKVISFNK
jgi:ATP-dependent Clp protease protease subunit